MIQEHDAEIVTVRYTNWRGVEKTIRLRLGEVHHGTTKWHPKPTYLISGFDLDHPAQIWKQYDLTKMNFDLSTMPPREVTVQEAAERLTVCEERFLPEALSASVMGTRSATLQSDAAVIVGNLLRFLAGDKP